ncbi:MAG: NERD domain-containing protein [Lachnospiraceae bacterium]|nr:NERD domain-containing protein [Lachnospiraceae bacterium]
MPSIGYIIAGIVVIVLVFLKLSGLLGKKDGWVSRNDFENAKRALRPNFSAGEFERFITFLNGYKGGYVRRQSGMIVFQDYTGKEKGDLKGIFYNLVFPNPNISVCQKEEFRKFLLNVGVTGIDRRPDYETRDSKLKNHKSGEEFKRKEVGNIGEQVVRNELTKLQNMGYSVINGPVLKNGAECKEYDHIVVGANGVFCLETKAFGMTEGRSTKAALFIDDGDKWIIRKNKVNRSLESPTAQILVEQQFLANIISDSCLLEVHPILVLCNRELFVKNNISLPYRIVRVDELCECIRQYKDVVTDNDRMFILSDIDKHRINQ